MNAIFWIQVLADSKDISEFRGMPVGSFQSNVVSQHEKTWRGQPVVCPRGGMHTDAVFFTGTTVSSFAIDAYCML